MVIQKIIPRTFCLALNLINKQGAIQVGGHSGWHTLTTLPVMSYPTTPIQLTIKPPIDLIYSRHIDAFKRSNKKYTFKSGWFSGYTQVQQQGKTIAYLTSLQYRKKAASSIMEEYGAIRHVMLDAGNFLLEKDQKQVIKWLQRLSTTFTYRREQEKTLCMNARASSLILVQNQQKQTFTILIRKSDFLEQAGELHHLIYRTKYPKYEAFWNVITAEPNVYAQHEHFSMYFIPEGLSYFAHGYLLYPSVVQCCMLLIIGGLVWLLVRQVQSVYRSITKG